MFFSAAYLTLTLRFGTPLRYEKNASDGLHRKELSAYVSDFLYSILYHKVFLISIIFDPALCRKFTSERKIFIGAYELKRYI